MINYKNVDKPRGWWTGKVFIWLTMMLLGQPRLHRFCQTYYINNMMNIQDKSSHIYNKSCHIQGTSTDIMDKSSHIQDKYRHIYTKSSDIQDQSSLIQDKSNHIQDKSSYIQDKSSHIQDKSSHIQYKSGVRCQVSSIIHILIDCTSLEQGWMTQTFLISTFDHGLLQTFFCCEPLIQRPPFMDGLIITMNIYEKHSQIFWV